MFFFLVTCTKIFLFICQQMSFNSSRAFVKNTDLCVKRIILTFYLRYIYIYSIIIYISGWTFLLKVKWSKHHMTYYLQEYMPKRAYDGKRGRRDGKGVNAAGVRTGDKRSSDNDVNIQTLLGKQLHLCLNELLGHLLSVTALAFSWLLQVHL